MNTRLPFNPVLLLCTLAEEVGHHFTNAKSNILNEEDLYSLVGLINISIDELKGRIWAVNFLVPDKEFKKLINNYNLSNKELAKYFLVTEEFIRLKWQLLNDNEFT